jgi:hypothetical protein
MIFKFWKRRRPSITQDYRELIASLPVPTTEQTENFAEYVVGAHSWYKHLPCTPPGAPFVFFLDPNAGRELVQTPKGRFEYRDRVDGQRQFHYTWMHTTDYRARFGHWQYATDHGTKFVVKLAGSPDTQVLDSGLAKITGLDGASIPVSPEVVTAGTMRMTAHVHEQFHPQWIHYMVHRTRLIQSNPDLAGYRQELIDLFDQYSDDMPAFERAMDDERARLRGELRVALLRVRTLLASG